MVEPDARQLEELTKNLLDEGKILEAGWVALRHLTLPDDVPPSQIDVMRMAYMAGAQHLWACLMVGLDPGDDTTPVDERRMILIAQELKAFFEEMKALNGAKWG